jgi:hypothetical protein
MAGTTRLELATSAVTGRRSNQLSYVPKRRSSLTEDTVVSNGRPGPTSQYRVSACRQSYRGPGASEACSFAKERM